MGKHGCPEVFYCPGSGNSKTVELQNLCDDNNSCDGDVENEICQISRGRPQIINKAPVIGNSSVRNLCQLHNSHTIENGCQIKEFEGPSGEDFGFTVKLNIGDSKPNCIHMFGENYVFSSCMGMCENSPCPLSKTPSNYSCPGRYNIGEYESGYFQCNNLKCVKYSQVCDLINDCGDMSD